MTNSVLKKLLSALLITLLYSNYTFAQTWTDITSSIISNPNMDGSVEGWTVDVNNAQNKGYQGASYSNDDVWIYQFAEAWLPASNGTLGDGNISQTSILQRGKYRLTADCIAVNQNNSYSNAQGVYLFAKLPNGTTYTTNVYTRNNRPERFTLDFQLTSAGAVEYGLMLQSPTANWIAVDNFTLQFNGTPIACQSVTVTPSSLNLNLDGVATLSTKYSPTNATFINFKYTSTNPNVAAVNNNGVVTAKGGGDAYIKVTDYNGNEYAEVPVHVSLPEVFPEAIVINEIQSSNIDMFLDPSMNYGSWIEIYNPTDKVTGLGGLYITDDATDLTKWRLRDNMGTVPAHGYQTIWFDHFGIWKEAELKQVNFKLDFEGGTIIISDGTNIIAQQKYPAGIARTSYARKQDGGSEWGLSGKPTPGASNNSMTFAQTQLPVPHVDHDGVVSSSLGFNINVDNLPSGAQLRYTTDGSAPTENSSLASSTRFRIDQSVVYRFRFFQNGYLPSDVVTRSFIEDYSDKPVISIATEEDNIYSTERGLFQKGPNGRPGNGQNDNCNWNMEWDRPVNFEYFDEVSTYALNQEVDMSICGGWSRANSPHSFKLKAAKYYYGKNSLDYQFFEGKPFLKHKVLQIRNGGSGDRLRDSSLQEMMRRSGLYIDTQSWKPVRVYINGNFYAELNMREPNNKHFAYANYGIDTDFMDQFEMSPDSGYVQMEGTKDSFNRLLELSANASDENTYKEISELLDIDEYINYMAVELYLGNWDWPQNNVKGFRDQDNGKFHFVVYDLDGVFSADINSFFNKEYYTFDSLRGEDAFGNVLWNTRQSEQIEFVTLFKNMLQNADFRKRFVDAINIIGGSVFEYDYAYNVADEMSQMMGTGNAYNVVNSLNGRQSNIANQLKNDSRFGVSNISAQKTTISSNVDGAQILINDIPVPNGKFDGYLFAPAVITASAPAGYRFKGWMSDAPADMSGETLFGKSSVWTYDDTNTSLDGTNWKTSSLSKSGKSPIGYDTNNSKSFNTHTGERYQTYYFTKTFQIADNVNMNDVFTLDYTVDDGMVVYINGQEAGRYNMPSGEITFNTNGGWAQSNPDSGTMNLPAGLFKMGTNTIAVEVHNFFNPTSSTDIYWDASLNWTKSGDGSSYYTTNASFPLPSGNYQYIAQYEKISDAELADNGVMPVKINEVSASNDMYVNDYFKKDDWIELYNTTDKSIDIAGMYITDNETSPQKFQIPANDVQNTIIPPYGHLVIWASKRQSTGEQIHTNFKLSNDDGSIVMLTSSDGEWSDKLTYSSHGAKETVGVYPDGGNNVYHLYRPTIGSENTLTSYAQYLYDNTPSSTSDEVFTLTLSEGWNWISHPLERNLNISEINQNANRILSQTSEAIRDPQLGWIGGLSEISPASGYKVMMNADDELSFDGPFFAEDNTIPLRKGWNWIGYPQLNSQTLSAALSKFSASEGDQIIGQYGFATYENGEWAGSLESLTTGAGYLYKSASPNTLKYSGSTTSASLAKPRFHVQPRTAWTVSPSAYPNVMGVVARLVVDGQENNDLTYSIGAFSEDGECRGLGKYVNGTIYITIYGDKADNITFKALDSHTGVVYDIAESLYLSEEVMGTRKSPMALHVGDATDIAYTPEGTAHKTVAYYNVDGIYVGSTKSNLGKGIYIEKVSLNNDINITKKLIVK